MKRGTAKEPLLFRIIRGLVRAFYPNMELLGLENIPDEPCIIVGNHAQINGPIACELFLPPRFITWCAGQMMHIKEVPAYAYQDFWSRKPRWQRPFFKLLSYLIAPLAYVIFNAARTVPVYKDHRLLSTFRTSLSLLSEGKSLVIFPEEDPPFNHILSHFQEGFVDLARLYYEKSGKKLTFVPLYIAPKLKKIYFAEGVVFDPENEKDAERSRICSLLMERITHKAEALPYHIVIPYRNIPKKDYPSNLKPGNEK